MSYGETPVEFVFSSELYKTKFLEKAEAHREQISYSLSNRFGVSVSFPLLADVKLYSTIEKRGFLIIKDGKEYQWQNDLKLGGERMI